MLYRTLLPVYAFLSISYAVTLSSSPTAPVNHDAQGGLTTPPPILPHGRDLRRRQDFNRYLCGTSGTNNWQCNIHSYYCEATILGNGDAYQFCSNSDVANQIVFTTFIGSLGSDTPCATERGTGCCYGTEFGGVSTNYYIADSYTVTGFGCATRDGLTYTYNPYTNLLDPPSFSASLAQLASSTASPSSTLPPSSTSPTSTGPPASDSAVSGGDSSNSDSGSGSGLSEGTKIGIGAGVGAGVGVVLIGAIVFICWRRRQKKKDRVNEISPSYASHGYGPGDSKSPAVPYSPPMSYHQVQPSYGQDQQQYYRYEQASPQWSPQPPASPQPPSSAGGYPPAAYYPTNVSSGAQSHELGGPLYRPKS